MKCSFMGSCFTLIVCGLTAGGPLATSHAQAVKPPTQHPADAVHHGAFIVELVTPLNSKKLKVGEPVEAKLSAGITLPNGVQLPGGTKVVGHVTQASSRAKGDSESSLGIVFDKIAGGGQETPISGVLQAIAPNPNSDVSTGGYIDYGPSLRMLTQDQPPDTQKPSVPRLNNGSTGVAGFKNITMGPGGVLTSTAKELKLETGTRMLLEITLLERLQASKDTGPFIPRLTASDM